MTVATVSLGCINRSLPLLLNDGRASYRWPSAPTQSNLPAPTRSSLPPMPALLRDAPPIDWPRGLPQRRRSPI